MKRLRVLSAVLLLAVLLLSISGVAADRLLKEKPANYIGAMRVVWCNEWVSLRSEPKKTSDRIAKIPLGDIVYSCTDINSTLFYKCEYQGQTGYVLKGYLQKAPECEPPLSSSVTKKMTYEELVGSGEIVLDWKDYNMTVIAAHEVITENRKEWEVLRVGCFIDGSPIWGHEEKAEIFGQYQMLKAFIGGVPDDWQVMIFDGAYGLSMLDLLSGKEKWSVTVGNCPMGNAAAVAVDENGTVYLAGTDGPDPVAISLDGRVLWKSDLGSAEIYDPYEIIVSKGKINVKYKSGLDTGYRLVTFDTAGQLLSVRTEAE